MNRIPRSIQLIAAGACLLLVAATASVQPTPQGDGMIGGQIYDAWYNELGVAPPEGDHPLWETREGNGRGGAQTWRCTTCHGWDYKGEAGQYNPSSPEFTGFPGVIDVVGTSDEEVLAWLNGVYNPDHDFSELIPPVAEQDLVKFLRTRLVDVNLMVDANTRQSLGDAAAGEPLYMEACAECHGSEGMVVNMRQAQTAYFLGDVAVRDPYLFIHVTRFGKPGTDVEGMEDQGWSLSDTANVLAYAQTMPLAVALTEEDLNPGFVPTDFSQQGDTTGMVIAAIVILAVVLGSVLLVRVSERLR